jgi:hypothetical protein
VRQGAFGSIPDSGGGATPHEDVRTPAEPPVDGTELLLWAVMHKFERLALECYTAHAEGLATVEKRRFVARLDTLKTNEAPLAASVLAAPVEEILARSRSTDPVSALIVQGLVLEHLGQAIYRVAKDTERATPASRVLAAAGRAASVSVTTQASAEIAQRVGTHERLYPVFAELSQEVMAALDALAEPVDEIFGERFGLHFADVLGEFAAGLITACTALGMQRRKVVAHLAGACMGL